MIIMLGFFGVRLKLIYLLGIKGYVVNVVDYDEIHIGIEL